MLWLVCKLNKGCRTPSNGAVHGSVRITPQTQRFRENRTNNGKMMQKWSAFGLDPHRRTRRNIRNVNVNAISRNKTYMSLLPMQMGQLSIPPIFLSALLRSPTGRPIEDEHDERNTHR